MMMIDDDDGIPRTDRDFERETWNAWHGTRAGLVGLGTSKSMDPSTARHGIDGGLFLIHPSIWFSIFRSLSSVFLTHGRNTEPGEENWILAVGRRASRRHGTGWHTIHK
jgi:hypothetical protein